MTSLNKPEFQMAIPVVTREYTPGACRNSRKFMRLPPRCKMRPDSPALRAEELRVPNQRRKEPRFPWWNWRESPEYCHNKRRTLMSPQECKIDWCTPNQLKMKHNSIHWSHCHLAFHIIYNRWLDILNNNPEVPWDTHFKSIGRSISVKQQDERSGHPYRLEMRADSVSLTEEVSSLSTSTSRGVFP